MTFLKNELRFFDSNTALYYGGWFDYMREGYGVFLCGSYKYQGFFHHGLKQGQGVEITEQGKRFGYFNEDKIHGVSLFIARKKNLEPENSLELFRRETYDQGVLLESQFIFKDIRQHLQRNTRSTSMEDDALRFSLNSLNEQEIQLLLEASRIQTDRKILDGTSLLAVCDDPSASNCDFLTLLSQALKKIEFQLLKSSSQAALVEPTRVFDFKDLQFDHKIASGGFSSVFEGSLSQGYQAEKKVAIKVYRHQEPICSDFTSEVSALSRLRHPNIIAMLGYCNDLVEKRAVVFEYLPYGTVFEYLHRRKKKFSIEQILKMAADLSSALWYMDSCRFRHCDVKSANLLLTSTGSTKLADFGLSVNVPENWNSVPLGVVGTFYWTAPEVLRGEQYTAQADMYSFGAVIWESCTNQIPFSDLTPLQVIGHVGYGEGDLSLPEKLKPSNFRCLIAGCLEKSKEERPRSWKFIHHQTLSKMETIPESLQVFFYNS
jgi:Protein tyrosine and serine/threonine kinase